MSDGEVEGVTAFAAFGGLVVAEGMPAVRQANCRPRGSSPLAPLFAKGMRHVLFPKIDIGYLKAIRYPDKPENANVVAAELRRWESVLVGAGASTTRLGIKDLDRGRQVANVDVYAKADRSGNPVWGVIGTDIENAKDVRFTFPRKAWTYDLVSGRACGCVEDLHLPLGIGTPYAFAQLPDEVKIKRLDADGARISVEYSAAVDGAVRITVIRPDGTEAWCYAKNLLIKGGKATHEIPFALSDPKGTWKVRATSIFGGEVRESKITL